jgi:imidazole glycerol-phosphate synthase subunit HisF
VKGVRFRDIKVVGDIMELAARYRDEGADELVFYDITASPQGRSVDREWVGRVARVLDIPFCVAGGIRSVQDAEAVLNAGAEKISINSPALANPSLINALSSRFGAQCVVIGIDSQLTATGYQAYQFTGDAQRTQQSGRDVLSWIREVQDRGAGEIVLNCMSSDGVRNGYDIEQLRTVREFCRVPLVASGGAGTVEHFRDVFIQAGVDAALAASVFHSGTIAIPDLKRQLRSAGIEVRPPADASTSTGVRPAIDLDPTDHASAAGVRGPGARPAINVDPTDHASATGVRGPGDIHPPVERGHSNDGGVADLPIELRRGNSETRS